MKVRIKATKELTNCERFPVKAERVYITICSAVFQSVEKPTLNSHQWRGSLLHGERGAPECFSSLSGLRSWTDHQKHGINFQRDHGSSQEAFLQLVQCSRRSVVASCQGYYDVSVILNHNKLFYTWKYNLTWSIKCGLSSIKELIHATSTSKDLRWNQCAAHIPHTIPDSFCLGKNLSHTPKQLFQLGTNWLNYVDLYIQTRITGCPPVQMRPEQTNQPTWWSPS